MLRCLTHFKIANALQNLKIPTINIIMDAIDKEILRVLPCIAV